MPILSVWQSDEYFYSIVIMNWFLLAFAAALLTAGHTMLEKKAVSEGRTLEVSWILALVNAIFSIPFFWFADFSGITLPVVGYIFIASVFGASALFLATKSLKHTEVSESSPFFALSPLVAATLAFLFLHEKITGSHFIGFILMVGGIFFLELKNFRLLSGIFAKGREKYVLYTLTAVLLFGVSSLFDRIILSIYEIDTLAFLVLIHMFLAIHFSVIFLLQPISKKELVSSLRENWYLIILLGIITYLQRYFYASAIQVAMSLGMVAAVKRLSSLFTVIIGGSLFHEHDVVRKTIATMIILFGLVLLVW